MLSSYSLTGQHRYRLALRPQDGFAARLLQFIAAAQLIALGALFSDLP
jgi:hypothetical protein